jgi:hypothetical protein
MRSIPGINRSRSPIKLYNTPADNVDYTRQTADAPMNDDAEGILRYMRSDPRLRHLTFLKDPNFIENLRADLNGRDTTALEDARVRQTSVRPEEKPFNQDEFFNNPEELKKAGRAVRPPKL